MKLEKEQKMGWIAEMERGQSIQEFLGQHLRRGVGKPSRYDSLTELHFSGTNTNAIQELNDDRANILDIQTLYESGQPQQIHIVIAARGVGQNLDIYIKGKALDDYLVQI